jgi:hypothetical protein
MLWAQPIPTLEDEEELIREERLGFTLEGTLQNDARDVGGELRDMRVYAKIKKDNAGTISRSG